MLVGRRRRLLQLPPAPRPRALPRARSASSACAGERSRAGDAAPGVHARATRTASRSPTRTCAGQTTVLVFYPIAFSPVCTDQFNGLRGGAATSFEAQGATLYGVSATRPGRQRAFREQLGVDDPAALGLRAQGRDVAARSAPTSSRPASPTRALVIVGPRRRRAVELRGATPGRPARREPDLRRARAASWPA